MRKKALNKMQSFEGAEKLGEEEKSKEKANTMRRKVYVSVDKHSLNSGSN